MTASAELLQQAKGLMNALQFEPAQKLFEKALESEPQSVDARIGLGRLALIRNETDQGVQLLDEALRMQPQNAEALALKGVSRMQIEDWKGAADLLAKARTSDQSLQMTYFNLAHSYRKLGNLADAETAARKAIELDDKDFQAHSELSYIFSQTKRGREAVEEMYEAIRINPLFLKGYLVLGTLYKSAGKIDEAIDLYKQAFRRLPKVPILLEELSDLYAAKSDYRSAYLFAVGLISTRKDFKDYLRLGSYALAIQDEEKAEKAFRIALTRGYDPVQADQYLKKILTSDNTLYNQADTLRKAIEVE